MVFSDQTLDTFAAADVPSYRAIVENFAYWDDIEIHVRGTVHRIGGNGFCGCSRRSLLMLLHDRARALGVELLFNQEATPEDFPDADLIVAADGINSTIRTRSEAHFQPHTDLRPNRFAWMGSTRPFDAFTFFFKERPEGIFIAHCYQYEPGRQHLGVGNGARNIRSRRAGPRDRGGVRAVHGARLRRGTRRPQADHQPQPLAAVSDDPLRPVDSGERGAAGGRQGDRAFLDRVRHQAGDGGRDRAARGGHGGRVRGRLSGAIRAWPAGSSGENPARGGCLAGVVRACAAVLADASHAVRVRRDDAVRRRSPTTIWRCGRRISCSEVDALFAREVAGNGEPAEATRPPMFQPFRLRGMRLANRVVVSPMCQYSAEDGLPTDWHHGALRRPGDRRSRADLYRNDVPLGRMPALRRAARGCGTTHRRPPGRGSSRSPMRTGRQRCASSSAMPGGKAARG